MITVRMPPGSTLDARPLQPPPQHPLPQLPHPIPGAGTTSVFYLINSTALCFNILDVLNLFQKLTTQL